MRPPTGGWKLEVGKRLLLAGEFLAAGWVRAARRGADWQAGEEEDGRIDRRHTEA